MLKKILICLLLIFMMLGFLSAGVTSTLTEQERNWLKVAKKIEKNGWIFLHIEGEPFARGFQRGYLTAKEIKGFFETLAHVETFNTAKEIDFFVTTATELFKDKIPDEYLAEMKGMVAGMKKAGIEITFEQMLFLNGFIDIIDYWMPQAKLNEPLSPGCSAFIATGDNTENKKIVMAHNTWSYYPTIRFANIIVDILPDKGNRILMQSWGPCIYSATDFFITSAGIMGTETTIFGFSGFDPKGTPVFVRARKAMQYADSIDEWIDIMSKNNNGAYACSWLLGDLKTNEIARFELGLKNRSIEKNSNGYFTGSNLVNDISILREETSATNDDIRDFCVARRLRWGQLMEEYKGKINVKNAQVILADHYDVYLKSNQPGPRAICGHFDVDNGMVPNGTNWGAYFPVGSMDAKVVDSNLARDWTILAKWGSPCGLGFNAKKFLNKHPQYKWLEGYLPDINSMPWTQFSYKN